MALYLSLDKEGTSKVTENNPISTKHTNIGDSKVVEVYIANDGKRKGVTNDNSNTPLIYTNIQIKVEGVSHTLADAIDASPSTTILTFDTVKGWNIGTLITHGAEVMYINSVLSEKSVSVDRQYNSSPITSHELNSTFVADAKSVALALPNPSTPGKEGEFKAGGTSITEGLDPSTLTNNLTAEATNTLVKTNQPGLYSKNSLIQIGKEKMRIVNVETNGNMTVIRGVEGTQRAVHNINDTIYCVGLVDIGTGHKFFIKNTPPKGLPTQKKSDVKIVLISDEEPL